MLFYGTRTWMLLGAALVCCAVLAACSTSGGGDGEATATKPVAYVAKVGYADVDKETKAIASKDEWEAFARSVAAVHYDDQGNETLVLCEDLKDYDENYFDEGNTLLVAYDDLGSGSYDPKIRDVELDGETLTVSYDMGVPSDAIVTTDMSGFVTVVEVPKGMTITTWNR